MGKMVVGLYCVVWLFYVYCERFVCSGVFVVGFNCVFFEYVGLVLLVFGEIEVLYMMVE